jgi:tripartite-type tricarboxylate transporter receptor subunit TctC
MFRFHWNGTCSSRVTSRVTVTLLLTLAAATAPTALAAQTVEDFYHGKAIKVIVPTGPGGTYALFGSLINERVSHYLAGSPALVMQFMPSGIQATNYLYNVPAKDGLTIGMLSQTAGMIQVLTPEHVKYDLRKFLALGLFSQLNAVLTVSERTPVKSVDDLKTMPITLGATDTSSYQYVIPQMMNRYLGTKIKVITGYKGIAETTLAMERGEVDGVFTSWLAIKEQRSKALQNDPGRVLLQVGYNSEPDLEAPLLHKLAPDDKAAKAFTFLSSFSALSRCLIAPPGIPDDRLAALRKAVELTIKDPEFAAELERRHLPFRPLPWDVQQKIMDEAASTPRSLVE